MHRRNLNLFLRRLERCPLRVPVIVVQSLVKSYTKSGCNTGSSKLAVSSSAAVCYVDSVTAPSTCDHLVHLYFTDLSTFLEYFDVVLSSRPLWALAPVIGQVGDHSSDW